MEPQRLRQAKCPAGPTFPAKKSASTPAGARLYCIPKGIKMNSLKIKLLALSITLLASTGAMAEATQTLSRDDYKGAKDKISTEYKSARTACGSVSGNANDICIADAKGKERVSMAELEASYKPSREAHHAVQVAKAEATYDVAKERCDDMAGNAKDVCVKEAKSARTAAEADAKARMKSSAATAVGNEKAAEAHKDARAKSSDARGDAASEKQDARYAVDKEKCGALAGAALELGLLLEYWPMALAFVFTRFGARWAALYFTGRHLGGASKDAFFTAVGLLPMSSVGTCAARRCRRAGWGHWPRSRRHPDGRDRFDAACWSDLHPVSCSRFW
jgi:hypothetical protein